MRSTFGPLLLQLGLLAAFYPMCGCGTSQTSLAPIPAPAAALSHTSDKEVLHEAELAQDPNLRAKLVGQLVISHLEAGQTATVDTGRAGLDILSYTNERARQVDFNLETDSVREALVVDSDGRQLAVLTQGSATTVSLPAGDFSLILQSSGRELALLGVGTIAERESSASVSAQAVPTRTHPGIYIQELSAFPSAAFAAPTAVTAFVGVLPGAASTPFLVDSFADYTSWYGESANPMSLALSQFFANGGQTAYVVPVADATPASLQAGLGLMEELSFNLLVLPDLPLLVESEADAVIASAQLLAKRKMAMALLDLPASIATVEQAQQWAQARPQFTSPHLAAYWPPLAITNPQGSTMTVAAAPTMAGIFALDDQQAGVWVQPAGVALPLSGVVAVQPALTLPEIATLDSLGLNALIVSPVNPRQFVAWGSRTLGGTPQGYIAPQRVINYVESSCQTALAWVVFEPASPALYSAVTAQLSSFLSTLWVQGGLQGATSSEAFVVQCDVANNPAQSAASGLMNYDVGLALFQPASFVFLTNTIQIASPNSDS